MSKNRCGLFSSAFFIFWEILYLNLRFTVCCKRDSKTRLLAAEASSHSFSSDLMRGVHAREKRGPQPEKEKEPLPSRAFSHARGHLRVSRVSLSLL